jgi:hypothetical protein
MGLSLGFLELNSRKMASAKTGIIEWFQLLDLNKPALTALAD